MNIIRMTGGLGNQMFSYALYLKFKSIGIDCTIDDFSEYEGHDNRRPLLLYDAFAIDYPRVTKDVYEVYTDSSMRIDKRIARMLRGRKSREYREASVNFDPEVLKQDNAYITGYFQSEKYFEEIKKEILLKYTFTGNTNAIADRLMLDNGMDLSINDSVAVHVRRGDYLVAGDIYGGICTDAYYRSAIKYICKMIEKPVFIVFSNDPEWTDNWFGNLLGQITGNNNEDSKYCVIKGSEESTGYVDMCAMSRCMHFIIANSSFSWWGAYIGRKSDSIVIAPSKWQNIVKQDDIYTDRMIRMSG